MKILVVSPRFPYPLEKGDKLRLYHQLRLLSEDFEIVLVSLSDKKIPREDLKHVESFVSKIYIFQLKKVKIFFRLLLGIFSKKPFQVLYFFNNNIKTKIEAIIDKENPDFIYNQLIRTAEYTRDSDNRKALDYMDSFSEGMRKRLDNSGLLFKEFYKAEYKRLKKYEEDIYCDFDKHSIISYQDKEKFPSGIKDKLSVVPNGVDMDFFHKRAIKKIYDISFVGNMGYRPNIIACEFFTKNIYPIVKEKKPDIKIIFAGARPHYRVRVLGDNNIHISGWLDDIRDAYDESRIFVAPIYTGIGQQNKILEAMSMQMPVITTPAVNNAIGATDGKDILIAESGKDFANMIIKLLENPDFAEKIGNEARRFIKEKYSWDSQYPKLKEMFLEKN